MLKTKSKLLTFIVIFILLLSSFSFATDSEVTLDDIAPISEPIDEQGEVEDSEGIQDNSDGSSEIDEDSQTNNAKENDLRVNNIFSDYTLEDSINGNVFIQAKNFTLDSRNNGGIIQGNLFVTAGTVSIKSDVAYSADAKDDDSPVIEDLSSASAIGGNAYIFANEFILEPGCEIGGDVYVIANHVEISPYASIYGTLYIISDTANLNGSIYGDLYGACKNFEMKYYGCINRDLHLISNNAILNGIIYRNAFIDSKSLVTKKDFVNNGNLELTNSSSAIILGDIKRKC